ncbi:MAG: right-handed parallel beta-helix repeat-containing protein [Clostridia bacterium]|nr:right-handed parallel beta-helix repeat-containing protein [Clostridia bacterium]
MENLMLNVRDFGAKGDGVTDDTAAIQAAIDKAAENKNTVCFPAGVYMCAELTLHAGVGLQGVGNNWGYSFMGGSELRLNRDDAKYLINITEAMNCMIAGLCIDGNKRMGENIHGLYKKGNNKAHKEDSYKIERCRIGGFSGDGVHIEGGWCYTIRQCNICNNIGNGILAEACDGFIIDNWLSGNGQAGFGSYYWCCSTIFTANRIEWNKKAGIFILCGCDFNFNGNCFDRSGGPGLSLNTGNSHDAMHMTITGNIFHRSGAKYEIADTDEDCHLYMKNMKGITCVGNSFYSTCDDGGKSGRISPQYGIIIEDMQNTVIKDNVWHHGVTKEFLVDKGGNERCVIKDNLGQVRIDGDHLG